MTENEELKVAISKKETTTEKNSEVEKLKAQIEQLKKQYKKQRNRRIDELQKENAELKAKLKGFELVAVTSTAAIYYKSK